MKTFTRSLGLLLFFFTIASAEAKTFKYDLTHINSNNGPVRYDGLNFSEVTSAILTINKTQPAPGFPFSPDTDVKLSSLEINFTHAAKLTATNFQLVNDSRYRAIVKGVWVYKEVIVQLNHPQFQINQPLQIEVFVSERTAFNNPIADNQPNPSSLLFSLFGEMRDVTPSKIVDSQSLIMKGKKLNLYLRDRATFNQGRESFAVEANWYGKGTKILYIPASIPVSEFDNIEIIGFVFEGPLEDPFIRVKFKDIGGGERFSDTLTVQELLTLAYGIDPSSF